MVLLRGRVIELLFEGFGVMSYFGLLESIKLVETKMQRPFADASLIF